MLGIHLILNKLYDRQYDRCIPEPAEHIINGAHILALETQGYLPRQIGQDNNGNIRIIILYPFCKGKNIRPLQTFH